MSELNIPNNPLTTLRQDIRAHWQKYLPHLTSRLEAEGTLNQRIEDAAQETEEAVLSYVAQAQGTSFSSAQAFWQAWEIYRNEWAFLPAEETEEDEEEGLFAENWRALKALQEEYYRLGKESDEENADGNEA